MAKRVPRQLAMDLIAYVKRLEIKAHFWDPEAKSAFEFARQMSSKHLVKKNATYECVMLRQESPEFVPKLKAEFIDGSVLEMETRKQTAADLRALFFEKAEEAEEVISAKNPGGGTGGKESSKDAPKKGGKK
jgi:hypothetical protein